MSFRKILCVLSLAFLSCVFAPAQQVVPNPAVTPVDRLNLPWWAERHQQVRDEVKAHPDAQLLMIGDSITHNYEKAKLPDENFQPTWQQFYAPRGALNLGFSGDQTQHVLWRLEHGEVDGLHPKVAVVLIGTNNTGVGKQTALQTESGIDAVIAELEMKLPQTRILLLGILPSELSVEKTAYDREINDYLATCYGENSRVTYLDIHSIFYAKGVLDTNIFYDPRLPGHPPALHPDTNGQRKMAEAIEPTLAKLMGDQPRMPLDAMTDVETSVIPVDSLEQDSYDWYARHHAELAVKQQMQPQVVMIGDSITHFWGGEPHPVHVNGPTAWQKTFGATAVLNMGFGWDRTQNVLWRLRQGEFDGLHPKWVVVNIGTNNMTGTSHARASTPSEVVDGVTAIVDEVHRRSPESRIVLMAIFPRGASATGPLRAPIRETNRLLAERYKSSSLVTWVDIGAQFLAPDGSLPAAMMFDGTHPTDAGYQIWADALKKIGVGQ
jgi:lysophospholipase L1-like esterase